MDLKSALKHGLFLFLILLLIGIIKGIIFKPIFILTHGNPYPQIWINSFFAVIILVAVPLVYIHFIKLTKKEWIAIAIFIMILTNLFTLALTIPSSFHESTNYVFYSARDTFPQAQYANTICFMHQIKIINGIESKCLFMDDEPNYPLVILHNLILYAIFLGFILLGNSLTKDKVLE